MVLFLNIVSLLIEIFGQVQIEISIAKLMTNKLTQLTSLQKKKLFRLF